MDTDDGEIFASQVTPVTAGDWVRDVITLLDAAARQLHGQEQLVRGAIQRAASLLRRQIGSSAPDDSKEEGARLLAWQARKVLQYMDRHIAGPVLVADLSALVHRSEAHFSRCFRYTFGESPHAFLVRRRLELASHFMLETDTSLGDIALRCGFTDQAHLNKRFREATGQTPAAWRRSRQALSDACGMKMQHQRMPSVRARATAAERFLTSSLL
jgi:AraC family transcriptional regulator